MKFLSRGVRSPPASPLSLQTPPLSLQTPPLESPLLETPPPPINRAPFPKTLYIYKSISKNIAAWVSLNPDYDIKVCDDMENDTFLLEEFGTLHRDIFRFIKDEEIQSTFLGICLLYAYGGFYSDMGNEPCISLDNFIESDIDFVTCNSYLCETSWSDMKINFNPTFIASQKKSQILKNCIDWYVKRYKAKQPYTYLDWSIMKALTEVLDLNNYSSTDGIYRSGALKVQIIKECVENKTYNVYYEYKRKRVININNFIGAKV